MSGHSEIVAAPCPEKLSELALKRVGIDTWHENVVYLHRDCAVYRAEGFQALAKVEVRANGRMILATLNVVDDARIVGLHELGLSEDAFALLEVAEGHRATVRRPNRRVRFRRCTARSTVSA
jgi:thymidine phosphorylase